MKHLIPLLLRSRVFRGLLAAACAVGVGAGIFRCSLDSLTLSPEQTAEKLLGSADGVLETWQEGQVEAGTYPEPPALLAASTVTVVTAEYSGQADLAQNGEAHRFDYTELPLPSAASRGRYELVSGRWPTLPGECVASGDAVGQWSSTHQQWSVNVVGKFREIYSLSDSRLACAPGTWRERAGKGNSNEALSASYYLEGPRDELLRLKAEIGAGHEASIMLRTDLLEKQQVSAQRFLGGYSLVFALLVGIPFVFSGMVARWIRGVQQVLVRSGIRPGVMLRAALVALLGGTFVVSAAACALGMLATLALRPPCRVPGGVDSGRSFLATRLHRLQEAPHSIADPRHESRKKNGSMSCGDVEPSNLRVSCTGGEGGKGGGSGRSFVVTRFNQLPIASHIASRGVKLSGKLGGKHG